MKEWYKYFISNFRGYPKKDGQTKSNFINFIFLLKYLQWLYNSGFLILMVILILPLRKMNKG